jgi:predicted nucleic acid-binding protein
VSAGHLLDTAVVSELRKGRRAEAAVVAWQAGGAASSTYLSVITLLEIRPVAVRDPAFAGRLERWYRSEREARTARGAHAPSRA